MSNATLRNSVGHAVSATPRGLFIDGRTVATGARDLMEIRSPGTGEVIESVRLCSVEDVDAAVQSAAQAFRSPDWAKLSVRTRARLVNKLADVMEAHLEELYELETLNNGRPIRETRAQLARVPDLFRYNAGLALAKRDDVIPVEGEYLTYTKRLPVGVVANVTPFNHPLLIACRNLAPTFASGCTTVVKPSEYTPLTTLRLAELFSEAGLPPGVFNVVTGNGAVTGRALSSHPGIRKLVLTGGTEAGRMAGAAAASNFARQTLELGGKTPVVVFDDFNVDQAVNYAAFGAFVGAGQTCVCAARHIVQRPVYDEFVEKLAKKAAAIRIGDPFDGETQMGPVISERQRQRVLDYVEIGKSEGARLVAGGGIPEKLSNGGYFVEPTVFATSMRACALPRRRCLVPSRSSFHSTPKRTRSGSPTTAPTVWLRLCVRAMSPVPIASPTALRRGSSGSTIITASMLPRLGVGSSYPGSGGSSARRLSKHISM